MRTFRITLAAAVGALLVGTASLVSDSRMTDDLESSQFACRSRDINRISRDRDSREWYSLLGIAKVNGNRLAVYALKNGARPDDVSGPGRGFADVFDSTGHLIRRFAYRENLNSPPEVVEYVPLLAR